MTAAGWLPAGTFCPRCNNQLWIQPENLAMWCGVCGIPVQNNQTVTPPPSSPSETPPTIIDSASVPHTLLGVRARRLKRYGEVEFSPEMTFDNYIVTDSNMAAHKGAQKILASPGTDNNPLFIHGSSGVGKTHLLHAMGGSLRKSGLIVSLVQGYSLNRAFNLARDEHRLPDFLDHFMGLDVLLIDDVQFVTSTPELQDELFAITEHFTTRKKQIVFSSDQSPKQISALVDRLRTRLESGLLLKVKPPNEEAVRLFVEFFARETGLDLEPEALDLMASKEMTSFRAVKGMVRQIHLIVDDGPITKKLVKKLFTVERTLTLEVDTSAEKPGDMQRVHLVPGMILDENGAVGAEGKEVLVGIGCPSCGYDAHFDPAYSAFWCNNCHQFFQIRGDEAVPWAPANKELPPARRTLMEPPTDPGKSHFKPEEKVFDSASQMAPPGCLRCGFILALVPGEASLMRCPHCDIVYTMDEALEAKAAYDDYVMRERARSGKANR